MSKIQSFMEQLIAIHSSGIATEHSYRSCFEQLFDKIGDDVKALNEPKRVECGAPDFIIQRADFVVGHVEVKDLYIDIRNLKGDYQKNQMNRYLEALPNLIYSNGLDWDFYRNGELIQSVTIGTISEKITPQVERYSSLEAFLEDFVEQTPVTIKRPKELAKKMAGKAKLIKSVLFRALESDLHHRDNSEIVSQFHAFKDSLIHDMTPELFADIYSETICYGMFAARLNDDTLDSFSRYEALEKLPNTNPFLKKLFGYVAGSELDERISWIIDDLADIFRATDVSSIMNSFGKLSGRSDPFVHFYETFLSAYNPDKRKAKGVWYTPLHVVNFIVRAVDQVLTEEFELEDGLADISKITIDWDTGQRKKTQKGKPTADGKNAFIKKEVHRVQVLDPATGTGTFLAEVIKTIAPRIKDFAPSLWSSYIERDLIPRVHGFELLMASYAMCHLKLEMILRELGYRPTSSAPRQSVYLTNSLEEGAPPNYELPFMNWLADEAKLANTIKNDMPIMCVVGNPPYLGESSKASPWLEKLMEDYKKEPGGTEKLKEKNSKWLNDMYVKFMRMSSSLIEKNEEGILGFISNHGYLDNPTFRGMRWHLLKTFEKIWILDLHGNAKRKEAAPNGVSDKNVFDIMQGVAIIIAVKKKENTNELAEVYKGDLWGSRASKYSALDQCTLSSEIFKKIDTKPPLYQFLQQDWSTYESYEKGFSLNEFMPLHGNGIVTKRDGLNIHKNADGVRKVVQDFIRLSEQDLRTKYKLKPDVRDWRYEWAKKDIEENISNIPIQKVGYRIFDQRFMFYSGRSRGLVGWPVADVMSHYIRGDNIGLLTTKAHKDKEFAHAFVTDLPSEAIYFSATTGSNAMNFPLYVYPEGEGERQVNFDTDLYSQLRKIAADGENNTPDELDTFDYIYGVLYCPKYRSSFDEFLKSNFPKIPWPANANEFWAVSRQGRELRKLHLLNAEVLKTSNHLFEGMGHNIIETTGKGSYSDEKVWINEGQYFSNVNERIWNFYIGGYQPLQKWLKDRKGQELTIADVKHYQRIIKAIEETLEIMGQIHITL
ncbi:type ISP restriction/modification enzyme [Alteromonas sp. A081]|uniref:type ISP restriction/modification enzyme n=1 Tax=Alteromonas sp. A081 TaxID=3410269 RepID=UPI003B9835B9